MKEKKNVSSPRRWYLLGAFLGTLLLVETLIAVFVSSTQHVLDQDAPQYLAIGQSLVAGHGFRDTFGMWPNQPSYARMPGWPLGIALFLQLMPFAEPATAVRVAGGFFLTVAGACLTGFGLRSGLRLGWAITVGVALALSPPLLYLAIGGMSEVIFVAFLMALLWAGWPDAKNLWLTGLLAGCAVLVRQNFLLVPIVLGVLICCTPGGRAWLRSKGAWRHAALLAVAIYILPAVWLVRNYTASGQFPLFSSLEGETLYGANNSMVADGLEYWGFWVFPDMIPGEKTKRALATELGEDWKLNQYYRDQGKQWIRSHLPEMPRLIVGKLVRAFVPVPWRPKGGTFLVSAYRILCTLAFLALAGYWWRALGLRFGIIVLTAFLAVLATTVIYYGVYRFTYALLEVLYLPAIAHGLQQWTMERRALPKAAL